MMQPERVSFSATTLWEMIAGSMIRTACGTSTRRIACTFADAERIGRLGLPARHGQDARAEDLREHGAVVEHQRERERPEAPICSESPGR
jgi:hypothetical protein